MLRAEEVSASYGDKPVLHSVAVAVDQGEFVALIGPNGSGKSTLIKLLARALKPITGKVRFGDQAIDDIPPKRFATQVAYVPQLLPNDLGFTVREMVAMGRYPHNATATENAHAVSRALQEAGIEALGDRPFSQLSGGERQLTILARALAQQAQILLLDEPTASLDLRRQSEILSKVRRWTREQGIGALAAIHDLNLASEFADRIALMNQGQIVETGEPESVLTESLLAQTYGGSVLVRAHPITARPLVYPLAGQWRAEIDPGAPRVHLICGGGTGSRYIYPLLEAGYQVTLGPLNQMDTDEEAARSLGLEVATETPFEPYSDKALERAAELIQKAIAVVVAPVPFGSGNLSALSLVFSALEQGKPCIAIDGDQIEERDFSQGRAGEIGRRLLSEGMKTAHNLSELLELLGERSLR